jgi:murein DD-endopeptidase MepM/ murein hydrolase activator NlpD
MKKKWLPVSVAALTLAVSIALIEWHVRPLQAPEAPPPAPLPDLATLAPPATVQPLQHTETIAIRKRDTFVAALIRHEIPSITAHEIAIALRDAGANLRQIRPGDEIELTREYPGRLIRLGYRVDPWKRFEVAATNDGWSATAAATERDVRIEVRQGKVQQSLWDAVESGALTPQVLLDLVQIFESEFDFAADAQPGDRFRLLVESRYADGVLVDYGRILAAQYAGTDETMTGVAFEEQGGRFKYFDAEGRSLRKMFLRSPLEFTRISSGFTYRRPHPVLGGVRPHLAIDYAAPTGTPVWAVADGVVVFAGRKGGNGIQVRLRHRGGYETHYNHLSRIAPGVRRGVQVSQKQVIGRVGSTGLSTGPHLDYRVSHNGRFVNPLNEKFFPGEPIAKARRDEFVRHAGAMVERLEREAPFQL